MIPGESGKTSIVMAGISDIIGVAHAAGIIEDAPSIASILANALSLILSVAGALAMFSFAVAGIIYVTAAGDEARMKQAKGAMTLSVIGAVVCIASLVVVRTVVGMV